VPSSRFGPWARGGAQQAAEADSGIARANCKNYLGRATHTKKASNHLKETELYEPIRDYLVARGYSVHGEVKDCDIAARKGDDLIVVELKRHFGVEVLMQATERQRITDSVYVGIPRPKNAGRDKHWKGLRRLLRQLELGLILVSFNRKKPRVEIAFHPLPYDRKKQRRRLRAIIGEMEGRTVDYNQGGSSKKQLMTAYRENAIQIACFLEMLGPQSPRALRALGTGPKTLSILYDNHYGWFARIGRGIYAVTPRGRKEIQAFSELTQRYAHELNRNSD
jgi:hypothetical protein